jgi:hypothetical protein
LAPVLEVPASLLLSEGDHTRWGPGGLPIHPDFRVFATLNPAEYSGRSVLSPAFKDRWLQWFFASGPGEPEYISQLNLLVHGVQPRVSIGRVEYQSPSIDPLLPELARIPGIDALIQALARFQDSMASAGGDLVRPPLLGRQRRERYVFTRRSLEVCARLWNSMRLRNPSECPRAQLASCLSAVYLNKVCPGPDRKAVRGLAQIAGLPLEDAT